MDLIATYNSFLTTTSFLGLITAVYAVFGCKKAFSFLKSYSSFTKEEAPFVKYCCSFTKEGGSFTKSCCSFTKEKASFAKSYCSFTKEKASFAKSYCSFTNEGGSFTKSCCSFTKEGTYFIKNNFKMACNYGDRLAVPIVSKCIYRELNNNKFKVPLTNP